MSCRTNCCKTFFFVLVVLALAILAAPAFAQTTSNTCIQNEYNLSQGVTATGTTGSTKLNCTANDVSIAQVTNIRDPQTGATLSQCFEGATFSFVADFTIKTTSSQSRENIGLYIATASTTQALTGSCVDNIISPQHQCAGAATGIMCGSNDYHETDAAPDNCGDTSSGDSNGTGVEIVTLVVDNFLCQAPAGSTTLVLPNCTSWQIPGGTIQCVSPSPSFPYPVNGPGGTPTAVPGTKAKCNCGIISIPITPVTVTPTIQKACTTAATIGPATFTQGATPTQSPTTCDSGAEGSTITYHVAITNTSTTANNNVVVDQVCDTAYGTIYDDNLLKADGITRVFAACAAGITGLTGTATNVNCGTQGTIAPGATQTCTFTAPQGELATVTDTVNASGHSTLNTSSTFNGTQVSSNSVTVASTDAPSSATVTKGLVSTPAGCVTVRYSVDVKNTSGHDENLSLSAFNDSAYGSITTVHDSVLGTTCGVASGSPGLGTLSGVTASSSNGGALTTGDLPVGADYKCQFDGQFCGPIATITLPDGTTTCFGLQNVDKVTGTIVGDESETVSQTGNTLTVDECFTSFTKSTP